MTIASLPDHVLVEAFVFYSYIFAERDKGWDWQALARVCSRWRQIIFTNPRRLDCRLIFTERSPTREMLDAFPNFPIEIICLRNTPSLHDTREYLENILVAFERRDQARRISLSGLTAPLLETFVTMMQEPFPLLTCLQLMSNADFETAPVIPDAFLGRSAPPLKFLSLHGIAFPGLPKFLFSARNLVIFELKQIPLSGYISPEVLADNLSALPRLVLLTIIFSSTTSRLDRTSRRPPPLTHTILPSLNFVTFRGTSRYLEDLVTQISAPLLSVAPIFFVNQHISDTPQLFRFISESEKLKSPKLVTIGLGTGVAGIIFDPFEGTPGLKYSSLRVVCEEPEWRVPLVAQLCSQSSSLLREVERLNITGVGPYQLDWLDNVAQTQWLEIFRPFIAVGRLYVSHQLEILFVPALKALSGEGAKDLLPALHSLILEGGFQSHRFVDAAIVFFILRRRFFGHPVTIYRGDRRFDLPSF